MQFTFSIAGAAGARRICRTRIVANKNVMLKNWQAVDLRLVGLKLNTYSQLIRRSFVAALALLIFTPSTRAAHLNLRK